MKKNSMVLGAALAFASLGAHSATGMPAVVGAPVITHTDCLGQNNSQMARYETEVEAAAKAGTIETADAETLRKGVQEYKALAASVQGLPSEKCARLNYKLMTLIPVNYYVEKTARERKAAEAAKLAAAKPAAPAPTTSAATNAALATCEASIGRHSAEFERTMAQGEVSKQISAKEKSDLSAEMKRIKDSYKKAKSDGKLTLEACKPIQTEFDALAKKAAAAAKN